MLCSGDIALEELRVTFGAAVDCPVAKVEVGCNVLFLPSMLCRPGSRPRGRIAPTVELRFLPTSLRLASSSASAPVSAEYSGVRLLPSSGLALLRTSSCNALILCQVFNLRPTGPSSNSLQGRSISKCLRYGEGFSPSVCALYEDAALVHC